MASSTIALLRSAVKVLAESKGFDSFLHNVSIIDVSFLLFILIMFTRNGTGEGIRGYIELMWGLNYIRPSRLAAV